jgi:hypothetical protein
MAAEGMKVAKADAQTAAATRTLSSSPSNRADRQAARTFSMDAGRAFSPPPLVSTVARAWGAVKNAGRVWEGG